MALTSTNPRHAPIASRPSASIDAALHPFNYIFRPLMNAEDFREPAHGRTGLREKTWIDRAPRVKAT
jgi:hypothetical protein